MKPDTCDLVTRLVFVSIKSIVAMLNSGGGIVCFGTFCLVELVVLHTQTHRLMSFAFFSPLGWVLFLSLHHAACCVAGIDRASRRVTGVPFSRAMRDMFLTRLATSLAGSRRRVNRPVLPSQLTCRFVEVHDPWKKTKKRRCGSSSGGNGSGGRGVSDDLWMSLRPSNLVVITIEVCATWIRLCVVVVVVTPRVLPSTTVAVGVAVTAPCRGCFLYRASHMVVLFLIRCVVCVRGW